MTTVVSQSTNPSPARRLRGAMAAVRVSIRWFGTRKSLTVEQKAEAAEPFNAFFFVPALTGAQDQQRGQSGGFSFGSLFRTHPTLERRLAQLDQLEHELGQAR